MSHHVPSWKCKLKQANTTTHKLEWPKSSNQTIPSADKDVKQQEISFIAGGSEKCYSLFGKQFGSCLQNYTYSYEINKQLHFFGVYSTEEEGLEG